MFTERSPVMVILLTFITCGIYGIYWLYMTSGELQGAMRNDNNPGLDILLGLVTCGLYFIYLNYRNGKQLAMFQKRFMLPENDVSIVNLILVIFGFGFIAYGITQDVMNRTNYDYSMKDSNPSQQQYQGPEIF